jgi:hypothetical protein
MNEINVVNEMTDQDWEKLESWLTGMLHIDTVTVTFTKKDGTERVMKCTLSPKLLPEQTITEGKKERKKPENTIAVYDVEAKGWRSFSVKSVKRIQLMIE